MTTWTVKNCGNPEHGDAWACHKVFDEHGQILLRDVDRKTAETFASVDSLREQVRAFKETQEATREANAAEVSMLRDAVETWKMASGLDVGGDPDGVTPDMLRADLSKRDAEMRSLTADNAALLAFAEDVDARRHALFDAASTAAIVMEYGRHRDALLDALGAHGGGSLPEGPHPGASMLAEMDGHLSRVSRMATMLGCSIPDGQLVEVALAGVLSRLLTLETQVATAEADNAALKGALKAAKDGYRALAEFILPGEYAAEASRRADAMLTLLAQPHPGATLLAEMATLRAERDDAIRDLVNTRANRDECSRNRNRLEGENDALRARVAELEAAHLLLDRAGESPVQPNLSRRIEALLAKCDEGWAKAKSARDAALEEAAQKADEMQRASCWPSGETFRALKAQPARRLVEAERVVAEADEIIRAAEVGEAVAVPHSSEEGEQSGRSAGVRMLLARLGLEVKP